jgi:hypothetical protein
LFFITRSFVPEMVNMHKFAMLEAKVKPLQKF